MITSSRAAADEDKRLGRLLRERRVAAGISRSQLAVMIGISVPQVGKYENGIDRLPAGRLISITNALGIDVDQLYVYEGTFNFSRPALDIARMADGLSGDGRTKLLMLARALVMLEQE